ncbi:hypothetical protein [Nitrosospira sp. Nsp14]|uniref:hypothetical protein n=1 Tax=Nitrosospira sp. Nsp14 TaxID=1855333 RepID=UPI000B8178DE|nr:hypothetical protein [Nitrosospira sp. Nsp14]
MRNDFNEVYRYTPPIRIKSKSPLSSGGMNSPPSRLMGHVVMAAITAAIKMLHAGNAVRVPASGNSGDQEAVKRVLLFVEYAAPDQITHQYRDEPQYDNEQRKNRAF